MSAFSDITARAGQAGAAIPDTWKQGRTAYGGLTAALMLAKVRSDIEGLPPLRAVLVNFTGPVTEMPLIEAQVLRRGRNVTTVYAVATIEEKVVCTATFSFGAARESEVTVERPFGANRPDTPDPEMTPNFFPEGAEKFAPNFTQNFDLKLIEGARPISGAERGYIRCWSRHTDKAARQGEVALLGIGDILPPAALPLFTKTGPVSSMTWMFNILREPETVEGWYLVDTDLTAAQSGYSSQVMRVYNRNGDLIADGMQSVAIFL